MMTLHGRPIKNIKPVDGSSENFEIIYADNGKGYANSEALKQIKGAVFSNGDQPSPSEGQGAVQWQDSMEGSPASDQELAQMMDIVRKRPEDYSGGQVNQPLPKKEGSSLMDQLRKQKGK